MREKRKVERFNLQIETILNVQNEAIMDKAPILLTRDISCTGVFLTTSNPLPIETRVDLDFLLNQNELESGSSKDKRINISTSGKVIRTDEQGMAVKFDKLYRISNLMI
jgi:hypothetical protein